MNIEVMRNTLYKAYLEDFYRFCKVKYVCTDLSILRLLFLEVVLKLLEM
jgi:vacuolar-type H+-ATPase subunit C/Vma6